MLTPHQALTDLVRDDPTRPVITFYDDTPGPTMGERIEISRRVLDNWVAKAANALQEGLDVQRGSVVLLDLPCPHWRTCYWALAVWAVGATLTLDASEGADVLVTTDPDSSTAEDADEVVVVTLAALAREYDGDLRSGVMDEAKEVSSFGDGFTPWDEPEEDDDALVHDGDRTTYADLFGAGEAAQDGDAEDGAAEDEDTEDGAAGRATEHGAAGGEWPPGSRVLVTDTSAYSLLQNLLRALTTGSSLVLVRGPEPADGDPRMVSEGVTLRA